MLLYTVAKCVHYRAPPPPVAAPHDRAQRMLASIVLALGNDHKHGEADEKRLGDHHHVDCARIVPDITDPVPVRSPLVVLSALAKIFRHKDVVEVGTRNGDSITCFAHAAKSATGIEMVQDYCKQLDIRSAKLKAAGGKGFRVECSMFQQAKSLGDADYITFWLGGDRRNLPILAHLHAMQARGEIVRPNTEAVIAFDLRSGMDILSYNYWSKHAAWTQLVPFDECSHCQRTLTAKQVTGFTTCKRAEGTFAISGFRISQLSNATLDAAWKRGFPNWRHLHDYDNYSKTCHDPT